MNSDFVLRSLSSMIRFLAKTWREWRGYIFLFIFVWIPVRSAVVDYSPVPTGSMNPTILEGDVVWVDKLAYSLRVPLTTLHLKQWAEPARGDIVVVLSPEDGTRLVKRIVGIPGDTLSMQDNQILLNGEFVAYTEPEANYGAEIAEVLRPHAIFAEENLGGVKHPVMGISAGSGAPRNLAPVTVPDDRYFLMGDSRDNSHDSRIYGFAERDAILGQAKGILVSLDINDTYLPRLDRFFTPLR